MAFSGHTTPQVVINSTANANPYTGSITVGSTSDLVVLFIQGWPGSGAGDPTGWTVTLDGSAITPTDSAFTNMPFGGAIYELTGLAAGSRALSVSYPAAGRACQALAFVISGHDGGTPVAGRSIATHYGSDTASLGYTRTTTRDGNIILSVLGFRGHVVDTEFSFSGGTLIGSSQTGTSDTTDITCAYGYHDVATAGSVTDTYSWTDTGRCHVGFVEVNIATGGGINGTASDTVSVTGSATGTVAIAGTAATTVSVTGVATGAVLVKGAASDTVSVTGAATGVIGASITGQAAGSVGVTGASTGKVRVAGSAASSVSVTGASTGAVRVKGTAAGSVSVTGSAVGAVLGSITGQAAYTVTVTGTATGVIGAVSLRRQAYGYESANGGAFGPSRTGGTFAATANGGKLQG